VGAIEADRDVALGGGGIAEEEAELVAVGEEGDALAGGLEDAEGDAAGAESIGAAAAVGGVEVDADGDRPGADVRAVGGDHAPAAVFFAFGGADLGLRCEGGVAEESGEGFEDVGGDAAVAALVAEGAELAAVDLPGVGEGPGVFAGAAEELSLGELVFELELDEGLRERRAEEGAVVEAERHG
jgi:hypothetical protein